MRRPGRRRRQAGGGRVIVSLLIGGALAIAAVCAFNLALWDD